MTEKITLEIKSNELKKMLLEHYKEIYKDESISIIIHSSKELVGLYEIESLVTNIKLRRNVNINLKIGKCSSTLEEEITLQDIKDILQESLNEQEYEVIDLRLDTDKRLEGFYETEHIVFNGLIVDLKKKQKQKIK